MIIYPNPANNQLTLDNEQAIMQEVKMIDMLGKEVKHFQLNDTKARIKISGLNKAFLFFAFYG